VQGMAVATGRGERLKWKEAQEERITCFHVLFASQHKEGVVAHIACHRREALAEARLLQDALSKRCRQHVAIVARSGSGFMRGGSWRPDSANRSFSGQLSASASGFSPDRLSRQHDHSDTLVLLLTKSTLTSVTCLLSVAEAIFHSRSIVSIVVIGRGYDFSEAQRVLRNLPAELGPEQLGKFRRGLRAACGTHGGDVSPPASSRRVTADNDLLQDVQGRLLETIPNVIAINWFPEGGDNQLTACVEEIFRRMPRRQGMSRSLARGSLSLNGGLDLQGRRLSRVRASSLSSRPTGETDADILAEDSSPLPVPRREAPDGAVSVSVRAGSSTAPNLGNGAEWHGLPGSRLPEPVALPDPRVVQSRLMSPRGNEQHTPRGTIQRV